MTDEEPTKITCPEKNAEGWSVSMSWEADEDSVEEDWETIGPEDDSDTQNALRFATADPELLTHPNCRSTFEEEEDSPWDSMTKAARNHYYGQQTFSGNLATPDPSSLTIDQCIGHPAQAAGSDTSIECDREGCSTHFYERDVDYIERDGKRYCSAYCLNEELIG